MTSRDSTIARTLAEHEPHIWTPPYGAGRIIGCECGDEGDYAEHLASVVSRRDANLTTSTAFDREHDRRIIENAQLPVVLVECPHVIGLCYDDAENGILANLPCPCNDPSRIVARLVPVDNGATS